MTFLRHEIHDKSVAMMPVTAFAAENEKGTKEDPWNVSAADKGEVTAYLETNDDNTTYTLHIAGSGQTKDFNANSIYNWNNDGKYPWLDQRKNITKVDIANGITKIGKFFFADLPEIQEVILPDTLIEVSTCAFQNCSKLSAMKFNKNLKTVGENAFSMVSGRYGLG